MPAKAVALTDRSSASPLPEPLTQRGDRALLSPVSSKSHLRFLRSVR
jgi:hypothetical protein